MHYSEKSLQSRINEQYKFNTNNNEVNKNKNFQVLENKKIDNVYNYRNLIMLLRIGASCKTHLQSAISRVSFYRFYWSEYCLIMLW